MRSPLLSAIDRKLQRLYATFGWLLRRKRKDKKG